MTLSYRRRVVTNHRITITMVLDHLSPLYSYNITQQKTCGFYLSLVPLLHAPTAVSQKIILSADIFFRQSKAFIILQDSGQRGYLGSHKGQRRQHHKCKSGWQKLAEFDRAKKLICIKIFYTVKHSSFHPPRILFCVSSIFHARSESSSYCKPTHVSTTAPHSKI